MSASVDDHSRVILDKVEGDVDSDYINASYIDVGSINQSINQYNYCFGRFNTGTWD